MGLFLSGAVMFADPPSFFMATAAGVVPGDNAIALQQHLVEPVVVAYDPYGNLYYGTYQQVWRLNADGSDTLVAGNGSSNSANLGDGGPATAASLEWVGGLAIDGQGNVYISDFGALEIRKVTPEGTIQRFAGTGALPDYLVPSNAASGVPALKVALNPGALAIDSTWLYVSDLSTWSVVAFTLDGKNSKVVAGNHGNQSAGDGGLASNASLFFPGTLALANGMLYINEAGGARVREVNQRTGMIATLVELVQSYASDNGNEGLAADSNGSVYLQHGSTIERIYANTVNPQPYAGGGESVVGDPGEALAVTLMEPRSLAVNPVTFDLSLADSNANFVETIAWGSGFLEPVAGMVHFAGDGGPAALAVFNGLESIAVDSLGNVYLADIGNNVIRQINTNGIISTIAGTGAIGFTGDGGPATAAMLNLKHGPKFSNGIAVDSSGNLFISDYGNGRIRKVDTTGVITTVAGGGATQIASGINAKSAALLPGPLAVDGSGNLYFGQVVMSLVGTLPTVYKIDSTGKVSAFGTVGSAACLATDSLNNLYICDSAKDRVVEISAAGATSTIAGNGNMPNGAIQPGAPTSVAIGAPTGVTVDSSGDIYISTFAETLEIDATGTLNPIAGTNQTPFLSSGDGNSASAATFTNIAGMAVDPSGNVYLSDGGVYLREAMPGTPPVISSGGVIGGGGSTPPVESVSPGAMVSIYGSNFSAAGTGLLVAESNINGGKLPTSLAGICVSFGGVSAAVVGVFPHQLNVLAPVVPAGPVTVQVTANCNGSHPVSSNIGGVAAEAASPEFFLAGGTIAATVNGTTVEAYGTGWGATSPVVAPGMVAGSAAPLASAASLTLGGEAIPAANLLYAGLSPCCAGVYQVDFVLPSDMGSGNLPLVITVNGISSPSNAYLALGH